MYIIWYRREHHGPISSNRSPTTRPHQVPGYLLALDTTENNLESGVISNLQASPGSLATDLESANLQDLSVPSVVLPTAIINNIDDTVHDQSCLFGVSA